MDYDINLYKSIAGRYIARYPHLKNIAKCPKHFADNALRLAAPETVTAKEVNELAKVAFYGDNIPIDVSDLEIPHVDDKSKFAVIRKSKGLTQQQLADKAGIAITQIAKIECSERKFENMTVKSCIGIAAALGMTVEDLYYKLMED